MVVGSTSDAMKAKHRLFVFLTQFINIEDQQQGWTYSEAFTISWFGDSPDTGSEKIGGLFLALEVDCIFF